MTAAIWGAVLSGALLGASFPSLGWSWASWFALVPLWLLVARGRGAWRTLGLGYVSGAVFFAVSCPWIATTVHTFGDLSWPVAAVVFLCFLILMGSYLALFAVIGYGLGRRLRYPLLPLPFLWVAIEWLRTYTPMGGFPWNLLGYAQYQNLGFMRVTAFGGIYAASFLLAAANTLIAYLCWRGYRAWRSHYAGRDREVGRAAGTLAGSAGAAGPVSAAVILAAILIFAVWPFHPPRAHTLPLHARLVQPNTPLNSKWTQASLARFLATQIRLSVPVDTGDRAAVASKTAAADHASADPPLQIVIWPEQPAPLNYDLEPEFRAAAAELQARTGAAFLFGEISYPSGTNGAPDYNRPRNSARMILPGGTLGPRYDKMHLVPFGEYVPLPEWLQTFLGVSKMVQGVGNFVPGRHLQLFPLDGHRFATMICYESIFPAIARRNVAAGAQWLVNQSDDSWYGRSSAQAQDLMMARVRAIENHRWLLCDTDDGITAVIDPYGRVRQQLPVSVAASLTAGFAPVSKLTFYTRHGDWLPFLCAVIMGVMVVSAWRRPAGAGPAPES